MKTINQRFLAALCRSAAARPGTWLLATALATLPAVVALGALELDTDLIRLLPRSARASVATRELKSVIGGDSYFALLVEGDDLDALTEAVPIIAARVAELENVRSVEYRNPVDFIERYRYLLVPAYYLERLSDLVLDWELEVNPFMIDLGDPEDEGESYGQEQDRKHIEEQLQRYTDLPPFHQSADGRMRGILVRPRRGTTSLGAARSLFEQLQSIAEDSARQFDLQVDVGGTLRNKVDEFDVIASDLNRSGIIAVVAILGVLLVSFRTARVIPILMYPLGLGLVWAFALEPLLVGPLNTISVFLVLVLFGMGIDYSIHLLKRFQLEISRESPEKALLNTYLTTGDSVLVSGITTALALGVLGFSGFRGFADFGVIGGTATLMVLLAMVTVMPSVLILGHRAGLVQPATVRPGRRRPPGKILTVALGTAVVVAVGLAWYGLGFDYDFSRLKADVPESAAIKERLRSVYATNATPGAIYVAPDLDTLDRSLQVLEAQRRETGSRFGRITSIRDFAPTEKQAERRIELVREIQEETRGAWTQRVEDPDKRRWIDDINSWEPPDGPARIDEVATLLRQVMQANDGSGAWLIGVHPNVRRSNGIHAMAFTEELYGLELPATVRGPAGETPVFGEILFLVIGESSWLIGMTFLGIFLMVLADRRSLKDAIWILLPLISGLALTLGIMVALGIKLNFFNIIVLPALLGMGVDHGVHYYARWREMQRNTDAVHTELFGPLSICTATTMIGYSGMVFANHQGLRSIGIVACIGLACIWATSLLLLPGLLRSGWFRSAARPGGR